MIAMSLQEVARAVGVRFVLANTWDADSAGTPVRRISTDSREVAEGDLFFAIRGQNHDGHRFIQDAAARGAVACIADAAGAVGLTGALKRTDDSRHGDSTPGAGPAAAPPVPVLVVDDCVAALGRLAAYYRRSVMRVGTTVIAVTGSNGKTTTKGMIDHVLRTSLQGVASPKSYNNFIGVPLTLLSVGAEDRYVVAEIGTNAPGEIAALSEMVSPHVGVITSIGEAHLEGLGGIEGVAAEKAALLARIRPGGLAVVNIDRPQIRGCVRACRQARVTTIGTDAEAKLVVADAQTSLARTTFELEGRYRIELPMPGVHHATNAAAAFAVARWLGLDCERIIASLRTFVPPAGRSRRIEANGMAVIDDAYNANPASVLAAVDALAKGATSRPAGNARPAPGEKGRVAALPAGGGRRVFVLGDMLELGAGAGGLHEGVVQAVADSGIEILICVGEAASRAGAGLGGQRSPRAGFAGGRSIEVHTCSDVDEACRIVPQVVRANDAVWIKGSRAMALDRLVAVLTGSLDASRVAAVA